MAAEMAAMLSTEEAKSFLKSKRHLLSTPNVVSLGFSNEMLDGKKTGRKIFRVGVIKKLSRYDITHPDIFIPKFFEHAVTGRDEKVIIPVKVVREGEIFVKVSDPVKPQGEIVLTLCPPKAAPYQGGSLIRNASLDEAGCLGANTQYGGAYRLLSAAHVLTTFSRNYIGKQILVMNGLQWVDIGATVTDQVDVVVYDSFTVPHPEYAKQDLAWADITPDRGSPAILEIGTPGGIRKIDVEEKVKFFAGRTGAPKTGLQVNDTIAETRLAFRTPSGVTKYAYFEDLCRIDEDLCHIVGPGDSGTAIVAEDDNALLGILISRSRKSFYFCKLEL